MENIVDRLKEASTGHPHAKIPWPHYVLHDARREILRLTQELEAAEAKGREQYNEGLETAAQQCELTASAVAHTERGPHAYGQDQSEERASLRLAAAIRSLKAPAIGSQGTEKGRG